MCCHSQAALGPVFPELGLTWVEKQQDGGAGASCSSCTPGRDQEFPPTAISRAGTAGIVQEGGGKRWEQQPRTFLFRVGAPEGRMYFKCILNKNSRGGRTGFLYNKSPVMIYKLSVIIICATTTLLFPWASLVHHPHSNGQFFLYRHLPSKPWEFKKNRRNLGSVNPGRCKLQPPIPTFRSGSGAVLFLEGSKAHQEPAVAPAARPASCPSLQVQAQQHQEPFPALQAPHSIPGVLQGRAALSWTQSHLGSCDPGGSHGLIHNALVSHHGLHLPLPPALQLPRLCSRSSAGFGGAATTSRLHPSPASLAKDSAPAIPNLPPTPSTLERPISGGQEEQGGAESRFGLTAESKGLDSGKGLEPANGTDGPVFIGQSTIPFFFCCQA
ncbi:uncharacterized protein LOC131578713 [Poecile atricapillus]|uniref:uncharacterized protein LOC131578713 n=1 Tax=Poecile atricapillus TaxID=48891 RepID=UPI0027392F5A|nr:uncharacterized protein LOC131578713 [Poecile atricapillus]